MQFRSNCETGNLDQVFTCFLVVDGWLLWDSPEALILAVTLITSRRALIIYAELLLEIWLKIVRYPTYSRCIDVLILLL